MSHDWCFAYMSIYARMSALNAVRRVRVLLKLFIIPAAGAASGHLIGRHNNNSIVYGRTL